MQRLVDRVRIGLRVLSSTPALAQGSDLGIPLEGPLVRGDDHPAPPAEIGSIELVALLDTQQPGPLAAEPTLGLGVSLARGDFGLLPRPLGGRGRVLGLVDLVLHGFGRLTLGKQDRGCGLVFGLALAPGVGRQGGRSLVGGQGQEAQPLPVQRRLGLGERASERRIRSPGRRLEIRSYRRRARVHGGHMRRDRTGLCRRGILAGDRVLGSQPGPERPTPPGFGHGELLGEAQIEAQQRPRVDLERQRPVDQMTELDGLGLHPRESSPGLGLGRRVVLPGGSPGGVGGQERLPTGLGQAQEPPVGQSQRRPSVVEGGRVRARGRRAGRGLRRGLGRVPPVSATLVHHIGGGGGGGQPRPLSNLEATTLVDRAQEAQKLGPLWTCELDLREIDDEQRCDRYTRIESPVDERLDRPGPPPDAFGRLAAGLPPLVGPRLPVGARTGRDSRVWPGSRACGWRVTRSTRVTRIESPRAGRRRIPCALFAPLPCLRTHLGPRGRRPAPCRAAHPEHEPRHHGQDPGESMRLHAEVGATHERRP